MKLKDVPHDDMFIVPNLGEAQIVYHKGKYDDDIRVVVGTGGGWQGLTPMSIFSEEAAKFTPDMEVQLIRFRYPVHGD